MDEIITPVESIVEVTSESPVVTLKDQSGNVVDTVSSMEEGYARASSEGLQMEVR